MPLRKGVGLSFVILALLNLLVWHLAVPSVPSANCFVSQLTAAPQSDPFVA
jgi:hypothetical protein